MGNYFWFYSTVAQVFAALWAVTGMFAVFRLELLDRKIKDALVFLLDFILVRFGPASKELITGETQRILADMKEHVVREVKESDKKEWFEWSPELLARKAKESQYVIERYDDHAEKELNRIREIMKKPNELEPDRAEESELREKIINEYRARKNVYYSQHEHRNDLINFLTLVTILDGLATLISLIPLFYLSSGSPLPFGVEVVFLQPRVLVISAIAIILSGVFILRYCRG